MNTYIQPAHNEHHYRKIVIIVAVLLGIVVLISFMYQIAMQKGLLGNKQFHEQYQAEQVKSTEEFFALMTKTSLKPTTAADIKAMNDYFTAHPATTDQASIKVMLDQQKKLTNQAFLDWKAAQK